MRGERVLIALECAAGVLVLTTALVLLDRSLRALASTLGRINMGVRAIEQQINVTAPSVQRLDEISQGVDDGSQAGTR